MGDAISHATLPGIAMAFILANFFGWNSKSLPLLLCGATVTGLLGVGVILVLRNLTRLKEDTALGVVLSVFFGAGIALLGVIQQMPSGHAAGLESFVFGKTASMGAADAKLIAAAALLCLAVCGLLYKELKLLCFDEAFAGSRGFPVVALDLALMSTVVIISIVGLQAVGLILMVAIPHHSGCLGSVLDGAALADAVDRIAARNDQWHVRGGNQRRSPIFRLVR